MFLMRQSLGNVSSFLCKDMLWFGRRYRKACCCKCFMLLVGMSSSSFFSVTMYVFLSTILIFCFMLCD